MRIAGLSLPSWTARALQMAVAVGLLALLWRAADGPAAARSLAAAEPHLLAGAFLALSLQTVLSALRWRLTARQLGIAIGVPTAISEYYLSQLVNQSLPGGMVGDAGRAVRSRGPAGLLAAGQAVAFERLAGQIALFAVLALAFAVTFLRPGGLDWPTWLLLPVATLLAGGLAMPVLLRLAKALPGKLGRGAVRLSHDLHRALSRPAALPGQIVLSIGTTACNLAAFALCAHAVGFEIGLAATTALVPLVLFTMLIPISVSGWGLREGAAAALLPLAGATASEALAASIAFGLTLIAAILPGAIFLWRRPEEKMRETDHVSAKPPTGTIGRGHSG